MTLSLIRMGCIPALNMLTRKFEKNTIRWEEPSCFREFRSFFWLYTEEMRTWLHCPIKISNNSFSPLEQMSEFCL